ncbi:glycosyltransferase [Dysgonomonas sp. 216]|uniref:glycosyltransferase n=1 Tax=Dysgonomonas sp. 216 TaxID=2302934 RepID=UPI0013D81444|nr:glycosyltransferase [Dysgonomonas sp. 216]NDW18415.1 glycosyltransferase [Dysgonomonas sp. 216]
MNDKIQINANNSIPLVSVMVLTYNHEKYVTKAIESIIMQQCSYSYEIVISDDYSTDNTRAVLAELKQKYPDHIRLIFNEQNKGVIRNYYETMALCKGKYIADCSGDDYWLTPDKLQKQIDILENNEDVVLVHTNWKEFEQRSGTFINDIKSIHLNNKKKLLDKKDIPDFLNQKNFSIVNLNTGCFRKSRALDIRKQYDRYFNDERYVCEDFQLMAFLLSKGSFYYIDDEASVYRVLDESVSQSIDFAEQFKYRYGVTLMRIDLAKELGVSLNRFLELESFDLFYTAFKAKRKDLARKAKELLNNANYKLPFKSRVVYSIAKNSILTNSVYPLFLFLRKTKSALK